MTTLQLLSWTPTVFSYKLLHLLFFLFNVLRNQEKASLERFRNDVTVAFISPAAHWSREALWLFKAFGDKHVGSDFSLPLFRFTPYSTVKICRGHGNADPQTTFYCSRVTVLDAESSCCFSISRCVEEDHLLKRFNKNDQPSSSWSSPSRTCREPAPAQGEHPAVLTAALSSQRLPTRTFEGLLSSHLLHPLIPPSSAPVRWS